MRKTLLALFAHPDDETFLAGGALARYGHDPAVRVVLGCATRGEAGVVHDQTAGIPEDMGRLREEELRCACRVLGIEELRFLGYRDSGTEGSPDNDHRDAYVRADPAEVVERILDLFRAFRPQVVLTFGPDGGSGHPDHLAIHRHATVAWECAGDPQGCPDLAADAPRKLYYAAMPRSLRRQILQVLWERGLIEEPPEPTQYGIPPEQITTVIDVAPFVEARFRALHCHRTQVAPDSPWLQMLAELGREVLTKEYYVLAAARGGTEMIPGTEEDFYSGLDDGEAEQ